MSMRAGLWTGLPDLDVAEHRYQVVACAADVDLLVAFLGRVDCNDGTLEHFGRGTDAEGEADHNVVLAVRGGWGYVNFVDNTFSGWPRGAADAPYVDEPYTDFPPGVGLPLPLFRALLLEFMATGRRPALVDWYDETDLFHAWREQRMALHDKSR
ncbi:Imm1 family immunity protein [Actinosynnema sp. NPDC020468]|uniref:Imm1 family immunity protein n=1 Tax=Actinosynnema sp. NPDC020468 TaxID=3154488 RepID=UPI0033F2313C